MSYTARNLAKAVGAVGVAVAALSSKRWRAAAPRTESGVDGGEFVDGLGASGEGRVCGEGDLCGDGLEAERAKRIVLRLLSSYQRVP